MKPYGIFGAASQFLVRKRPEARGWLADCHAYHKQYSFQRITRWYESKFF